MAPQFCRPQVCQRPPRRHNCTVVILAWRQRWRGDRVWEVSRSSIFRHDRPSSRLIVIGMTQGVHCAGHHVRMHKLIPDKLTETTYGTFPTSIISRSPLFEELLLRLTIIFLGTTFVLTSWELFLVARYINGRWRFVFWPMLFLSEIGAHRGERALPHVPNWIGCAWVF